MLESVEIISDQGDSLLLPLYVESDGYLIEDIEGLDPVKANMVSTAFASMDGEVFQASRREKRNPVMTLKLLPDWGNTTVKELRNELYKFLMPKMSSTLRFHMEDGDIFELPVRVESFEAPLFVSEPKAVISMIAFDPDFVALEETVLSANTTSTSAFQTIQYDGTVSTGGIIQVAANRAFNGFTIHNELPSGIMQTLEFSDSIASGDTIKICTIPGIKEATRIRGGNLRSVLNGVSPYSQWIHLEHGLNKFRIFAEGAGVPYTFTYKERQGGL